MPERSRRRRTEKRRIGEYNKNRPTIRCLRWLLRLSKQRRQRGRREKMGREKRENRKREELENIIKSLYQPVSEGVAEALKATKAAGNEIENTISL
jgi:hypothetical protein